MYKFEFQLNAVKVFQPKGGGSERLKKTKSDWKSFVEIKIYSFYFTYEVVLRYHLIIINLIKKQKQSINFKNKDKNPNYKKITKYNNICILRFL